MKNIFSLLAMFALLSAAAAQPATAEDNLEKVELRLDWALTGYQFPFYWALKKGYYRDEGLDVDIKPGAGSQQTINLVAGEHDDVGIADYSLMATSIGKGMKVKAIFAMVQNHAWAIFSHVDKPIRKPEDLLGKSVVMVVDHKPMIDLLMKLNGVDPTAVQLRLVNPPTRGTVFAQRAADGILAIAISSGSSLGGGETTSMALGDYGVNLLGQGIIASDAFLEKRPDVARRFIKATSRAFRETILENNIDEANLIAVQMSATTGKQVEASREEWKNTIPKLSSMNAPGKPVGWMSEMDWRDTMKTLRDTGRVNTDIDMSQLYTNDFIPGE